MTAPPGEHTTVEIGWKMIGSGGQIQDETRPLTLAGRELAQLRVPRGPARGEITTLIRTTRRGLGIRHRGADHLVVHIERWTAWPLEPSIFSLEGDTSDADFKRGGKFETLGLAAGLGLVDADQGAA